MPSEDVPEVGTVEAVKKFLFNDFPSRQTFTTKDYEKDDQQTTPEALNKRFEGYQKICMYGLGSAFMGAAVGVLDSMQNKKPDWVHLASFYFAFSLVLMLTGLSAATFPSSTHLALGTAGLGAWKAYIYMLATFHVVSLKFHSHVNECIYSMIFSTIVVTFHWGYSSQDPLMLHVLSKAIVWVLGLIAYGICKFLKFVFLLIVEFISGLVSKRGNSQREPLLGNNSAYRNARRSYESNAIIG